VYIDTVYLGTYNQSTPITGHFKIKDEGFTQEIRFTTEEAATIQELCAKALERHKSETAARLLAADIRVPQLEAPKPDGIEDADFSELF
jgi:hypothetical protein